MQFLQKNQRFKRGEEGKVIFYKENFLNEFFYVCLFICIFPGACVKVFGNVEKHNTIQKMVINCTFGFFNAKPERRRGTVSIDYREKRLSLRWRQEQSELNFIGRYILGNECVDILQREEAIYEMDQRKNNAVNSHLFWYIVLNCIGRYCLGNLKNFPSLLMQLTSSCYQTYRRG